MMVQGEFEEAGAMRVFSCFIRDRRSQVPTLSFVFAADEGRAKELARRQMAETPGAVCVEICEDGALVAVEPAQGR